MLIVLGALAVDSAAAYLGQRQLGDATAAAANDAAGGGLSNGAFYRSGVVTLDPTAASRIVCQTLAAQADTDVKDLQVAVAVGADAVGVRASATVPAVFGHRLPLLGDRRVSAVAVAYTSRGPGSTIPPPPSAYQPLTC